MRKYFFASFLFLSFQCFAQKNISDFGKISIDELRLPSCPFEPSADAMKLFDVQESEFMYSNYDSKIKTEKRVRIKIFNEKGYKYASIKIPYYAKKSVSKIKDIKGVIYNLDANGNIVMQKLEKTDFFKEKSEENVAIINFTFPNLKPGSVIEFSFTRIEKNIYDFEPWIVQDQIPVAYSSMTIITPVESRVKEKVFGEDSVNQNTENITWSRTKKTYFKENIRSFEEEPFMSSVRDNLLRVVFKLIPRSNALTDLLMSADVVWRSLGENLQSAPYFEGQIQKTIPGTLGLIDSARKMKSISGRIKLIFDSVKKRAPERVEQAVGIDDLTDAWNNKNGNSAEINLILLNLLEKADVPCCAMLVSTKGHGKININFPSFSQFNGIDVLAMDGNRTYMLDASLKWQSYNNPPFDILNRRAFLLIRNNMKWITVSDERPLVRQDVILNASLKDDGNIDGVIHSNYFDYAKTFVLDSTSDDGEEEGKFVNNKHQELKILSKKIVQTGNDSVPLEEQMEFNYKPEATGDFYFINPQTFFSSEKNPFTANSRNTDIDFGCNQQLDYSFQLDIPASYEAETLPKNIVVRAPDSSFLFRRICSTDGLHVSVQQTFEVKRSLFDKQEYPSVQEFFKRVYALLSEEIVLKKKK